LFKHLHLTEFDITSLMNSCEL